MKIIFFLILQPNSKCLIDKFQVFSFADKKINFLNSQKNNFLQKIHRQNYLLDSLLINSNVTKKGLIKQNNNIELFKIAKKSNNLIVALFAYSQIDEFYSPEIKQNFYEFIIGNWDNSNSIYMTNFLYDNSYDLYSTMEMLYLLLLIILLIIILGYLFMKKIRVSNKNNFEKLSVTERKIFELLKNGLTNKEIATEFNISISTVKSHTTKIYSKLEVKSKRELMNIVRNSYII